MMNSAEQHLPKMLLWRASLRNGEYAWRINDIPEVIEAARMAGLVNIGGQLQFRVPEAICECYWVEVDTYKGVSDALPWKDRVTQTAQMGLAAFVALSAK